MPLTQRPHFVPTLQECRGEGHIAKSGSSCAEFQEHWLGCTEICSFRSRSHQICTATPRFLFNVTVVQEFLVRRQLTVSLLHFGSLGLHSACRLAGLSSLYPFATRLEVGTRIHQRASLINTATWQGAILNSVSMHV